LCLPEARGGARRANLGGRRRVPDALQLLASGPRLRREALRHTARGDGARVGGDRAQSVGHAVRARKASMSDVDVLVVDDDGDTRGAIVTAVVSLGYPCQSARDGREALEVYAREGAAIVLADWRMPHLDGLELCRALKREPSPPYVILMST